MSYNISDASYFDPGPVAYPDEPFEPVPGWGMRPNMAGPRRVGVGAFSVTLGVAPRIASEVRNGLTFITQAAAKALALSLRTFAPAPGSVLLVNKSTTTSKPAFVQSSDPVSVMLMAAPKQVGYETHAIVLGPAAVIQAASVQAAGQAAKLAAVFNKPKPKPALLTPISITPPRHEASVPTTQGQGSGFPVDVGGGGSGFPTDTGGSGNAMDAGPILADVQQTALAATPAWVVPVVVGFSALALIALAYSFKKAGAA